MLCRLILMDNLSPPQLHYNSSFQYSINKADIGCTHPKLIYVCSAFAIQLITKRPMAPDLVMGMSPIMAML